MQQQPTQTSALIEERKRLDALIEKTKSEEIAAVRLKVNELIVGSGFTVEEIFPVARTAKPKSLLSTKLDIPSKKTLPPRYRDPEDQTKTWSGVGFMPRWLSDKVMKGESVDRYRVS